MTNLENDFYLVVTYNERGGYNRELSFRTTKNKPDLGSMEIAIKCRIKLPKGLFEKPALSAKIEIPEDAIPGTAIDLELTDNIEQLVKQNLGIDLKIGVPEE